jgi:hypothetical protein
MNAKIQDTPYIKGAKYIYQAAKIKSDKNHGRLFELIEYLDGDKSQIMWLDTRRYAKIEITNAQLYDYLPDENEYINIGIILIHMGCWKCKKSIPVVAGVRLTCQNEKFDQFFDFPFLIDELLKTTEVKKCLSNNQVGEVKERFSKTSNQEYLSNGCIHCDSIVGDFYLREELLEWLVCDNLPAPTCHARMKYSEIRNYIGRDFVFEKDPRQIIEYIEVEDVDFDND